MSRKLIELLIDEAEGAFGVEAISLVKEPAIEVNWVAFNKEQGKSRVVQLAQVDEEQRTLIAPALVPDFKIVRYDEANNEEYDVYFSKETCKLASELYMKSQRNLNHTYEHAEPVEGVSVVESWIVQDPKMDKANLYGFNDLNEGTWMVRAKVDNDEVWQQIKSGDVRGLSIEGYFLDKLEKLSKAQPKKPTFWQTLYNKVTGRNFYAEATLTNGDVLVTESEEFSAGCEVYTLNEQGEPTSIDSGTYQTEAGVELEVYDGVLVEYDGEVKAIEEKEEEVTEAEPVELDAMKVNYYKALLKNRYAKSMAKQRKSATLSAVKQQSMSAQRQAQNIIDDNLDAWGENGEGLAEAISEIALNVDPELVSSVYDPMMDASKASERGDLDKARDYLSEAYDNADRNMQVYIDQLLLAIGTLEQYS
jgi:hypothetical protein